MNVIKLGIIGVLFLALSFVGCNNNEDTNPNNNTNKQFGIFKVLDDKTTVEMKGVITSTTLNDYNNMVKAYPNVNTINMKNCPGSADDTVNLQVSKKVHDKGMNIHITDNSEIASGAVDFFVAGAKRTKGKNVKIGVHSWGGDGETATDFPVGHANHQPYIDYYKSIGFSDADAKAFYYFTINAAPASGIHWMTDAEIAKYKLLKN